MSRSTYGSGNSGTGLSRRHGRLPVAYDPSARSAIERATAKMQRLADERRADLEELPAVVTGGSAKVATYPVTREALKAARWSSARIDLAHGRYSQIHRCETYPGLVVTKYGFRPGLGGIGRNARALLIRVDGELCETLDQAIERLNDRTRHEGGGR